jgi:nicotinate dehydrogenase subunit B
MSASIMPHQVTRRAVLKGGALTVGFACAGIPSLALSQGTTLEPRLLDPKNVDSFLSVNSDGTVTVFCGKVDLGQGLRIAIRQIAGEELGIGVDKIHYVEGDTRTMPHEGT